MVAKEADQFKDNIGGGWQHGHIPMNVEAHGACLVARVLPETGGEYRSRQQYAPYDIGWTMRRKAEIEG